MLKSFKASARKPEALLYTSEQLEGLYIRIMAGQDQLDMHVEKQGSGITCTLYQDFYVERRIEFWGMIGEVNQLVVSKKGDIHTRSHDWDSNTNSVAFGKEVKIVTLPENYQTLQQYTQTDIKILEAMALTSETQNAVAWIVEQKRIGQPPFYTPNGNQLIITNEKTKKILEKLVKKLEQAKSNNIQFVESLSAKNNDILSFCVVPAQNIIEQCFQRGDSDIYVYRAHYNPQSKKLSRNFKLVNIIQKPNISDHDFKDMITQMLTVKAKAQGPMIVDIEEKPIAEFAAMTLRNHLSVPGSLYIQNLIKKAGVCPSMFNHAP